MEAFSGVGGKFTIINTAHDTNEVMRATMANFYGQYGDDMKFIDVIPDAGDTRPADGSCISCDYYPPAATSVELANYTLSCLITLVDDNFVRAVTVTASVNCGPGGRWMMNDISGSADTNHITLTDIRFDSTNGYTISENYGAVTFEWNGSTSSLLATH